MKSTLFLSIALLIFNAGFSQTFEVKANSQRQVNDSIIITDTFLLRQNSMLTFNPALRSCNISCNVFIAEKGAKINGRGANGVNGNNARSAGGSGTSGQNGVSGIKLKLQAA